MDLKVIYKPGDLLAVCPRGRYSREGWDAVVTQVNEDNSRVEVEIIEDGELKGQRIWSENFSIMRARL